MILRTMIRNMTGECEVRIGTLAVNTLGNQIEIVALDEHDNIVADSYGCFQADNAYNAKERVLAAHGLFQALKDEDRQLAAQEAFRSLVGGYDVR